MRKIVLLVGTACLISSPALAQQPDRGKPAPNDGWEVSIGGGAIYTPQYLGDDDYALNLVPSIRVNYEDKFFASVEGGVGYSLINSEIFRAGPLAQIVFGRDEDGGGPFRISGDDSADLIGLGDVDTGVELGGFAELDLGNVTSSLKVGKAISAHEGFVAELGISYKGTLQFNGPPLIYSIGPRLNFGDADYSNTYFGVTQAQALASGLPEYEAEGGITSYGLSGTAIMPLTDSAAMTFIASYTRLIGDVADAPLVQQRGSEDQAFAGAIFSYAFN
ncbi:MAG: MipA/OmpV family protein [Acidimicrobiales bacterium]|nr:MAG: MipA/OmpV family protein [Acidimicrobiales bacterium]